MRSGVKIAFGADAGMTPTGTRPSSSGTTSPGGWNRWRPSSPPPNTPRRVLEWEDHVGAIAPGRFADIIAVDGNPLEDMTLLEKVRFVMKGGEVYRAWE